MTPNMGPTDPAICALERRAISSRPSLGDDFSALLALQLIEWLEVLARRHPDQLLSVVDVGPGEGHLIDQLRPHLAAEAPDLIGRLECVLVELNPGMEARQRSLLSSDHPIPCRWSALETLVPSH